MLELLREKNLEKFLTEFGTKTLPDILGATLEFNNYRSYFKIDEMGNIKTKKPNMPLIKLALLGNEYLNEYFNQGLFITEKRKFHKIDRLADFTVENLEKNLYKVFYNRDLSIGLRYSKEFILKDKSLFIKKISHFVLLDEIKNEKALLTLAFIKALENADKKNVDFILYSFLPYIINYPSYINQNKKQEIEIYNINELDLNGLAYLNLITYAYEEFQEKYFFKLSDYVRNNGILSEEKELFERLSEKEDELYKMWNRVRGINL